jgi:hypothetical protein
VKTRAAAWSRGWVKVPLPKVTEKQTLGTDKDPLTSRKELVEVRSNFSGKRGVGSG